MQSWRKIWLASLLVVLLTGCSSTRFLYNRLDFILPWYAGHYVHLDRQQKRRLDSLLEPFLQWHRSEELPTYLVLVENAQAALDGELTADQLGHLLDDVQRAWRRTEARALEWLIALGETLTPKQMAGFVDKLREEQAEWEEEDLARDDGEYRGEVLDLLQDYLEDYLGRLERGQVARLESAVGELQRADAVWLAERARWLDRLEQILQREPGWQDVLREAIATREAFNSPQYREVYAQNAAVLCAAVAAVVNARSERQDRRLRGKLRDLHEDLEILIEQAHRP